MAGGRWPQVDRLTEHQWPGGQGESDASGRPYSPPGTNSYALSTWVLFALVFDKTLTRAVFVLLAPVGVLEITT